MKNSLSGRCLSTGATEREFLRNVLCGVLDIREYGAFVDVELVELLKHILLVADGNPLDLNLRGSSLVQSGVLSEQQERAGLEGNTTVRMLAFDANH